MENKNEKIQLLSPVSQYSPSPMSPSPSPKSFKVRSPKSFIKKIKSSGSLSSIPLVHSSSNLSQKSGIHHHYEHDFDDIHSTSLGLEIDTENEEDDLFKTIHSMNQNQDIKIVKKVKVKNSQKVNSLYSPSHRMDGVIQGGNVEDLQSSKDSTEKKPKDYMKKKKKIENEDEDDMDRKNQLFTVEPPIELVKKIMELFLGKNMNNPYYQFSRKMLEDKKIVEEMNKWVPKLKEYYLKCKHTKYLEKIDSKKCITIFRQLLRVHGYKVNSTEKYQNGSKFLLYQVEKQKERLSPKKINFTIDFD